MKNDEQPYVPPATAKKIVEHQLPGSRHAAALDIAISLVGNKFPASAVYDTLRAKFGSEKSDKELRDIVEYAVKLNPQPSGDAQKPFSVSLTKFKPNTTAPAEKKRSPIEHCLWWLNGIRLEKEQFAALSQLPINKERSLALADFLEFLYVGSDNINVVCAYILDKGKAKPKGPGRTQTRDKWVEYVNTHGVPCSEAGAWFRLNPTEPTGTGNAGSMTDSDVVSYRFMLLESDTLPVDIQFALFSKFNLPIAAVVMSGGNSVHGIVRLDAKTSEEYDRLTIRILTALAPFGIDQSNKNPSRLSRFPMAIRKIGAVGSGLQELLWLNPGKKAPTEAEIVAFEESLLIPSVEEKPFKRLINEAIPRYEWMMANRGKLGVPTGFSKFDQVSGGLKPGGYTLIAGATGQGKSTVALNILNCALKAEYGVLLVTPEMSREDVTDMMFSMNCKVDRNLFNTGEFTEQDIRNMIDGTVWMQNLPLWVEDNPAITLRGIRRRVLALTGLKLIGLVVVDYAQLVLTDDRTDNREQAVAAVALELRQLSREANIPIVVLSQLNDDGKVRESRKLSHEASTVMFIERKDQTSPHLTLRIGKGRKIPSTPIELELKAEYCLVTEVSPVADDSPRKTTSEPYND